MVFYWLHLGGIYKKPEKIPLQIPQGKWKQVTQKEWNCNKYNEWAQKNDIVFATEASEQFSV